MGLLVSEPNNESNRLKRTFWLRLETSHFFKDVGRAPATESVFLLGMGAPSSVLAVLPDSLRMRLALGQVHRYNPPASEGL